MRALLDVNVLIALLDADHALHHPAQGWFRAHVGDGWATCPITENGCLRIMAQAGYPNSLPTGQVAMRLREAMNTPHHAFWPDDASILDTSVIDWSRVIGPKQITDVYLLALARKHGGRFVTFDSRIAPSMVEDGYDHFCTINPP